LGRAIEQKIKHVIFRTWPRLNYGVRQKTGLPGSNPIQQAIPIFEGHDLLAGAQQNALTVGFSHSAAKRHALSAPMGTRSD
jgi:hypothetical protein